MGNHLTFSNDIVPAPLINQGRINIQIEHNIKPNDSLDISSNIYIIDVSELLEYKYIAIIK